MSEHKCRHDVTQDCPACMQEALDHAIAGRLEWRREAEQAREREKKLLAEKIQDKKDLYDYCVRAESAETESARLRSELQQAQGQVEKAKTALEEIADLGADGATAVRLGNIAHAASLELTSTGLQRDGGVE